MNQMYFHPPESSGWELPPDPRDVREGERMIVAAEKVLLKHGMAVAEALRQHAFGSTLAGRCRSRIDDSRRLLADDLTEQISFLIRKLEAE